MNPILHHAFFCFVSRCYGLLRLSLYLGWNPTGFSFTTIYIQLRSYYTYSHYCLAVKINKSFVGSLLLLSYLLLFNPATDYSYPEQRLQNEILNNITEKVYLRMQLFSFIFPLLRYQKLVRIYMASVYYIFRN